MEATEREISGLETHNTFEKVNIAASAVSVVINASSQLLPQIQILHTADKLPASNRTQLVKAFKCSFDLIEVIFETPRVSHPPTRDQPGSKTYKDRSSMPSHIDPIPINDE